MSTAKPEATLEANFDGLVGPTHHYAGLSFGNVASERNARRIANPREAARQGLMKMQALAALGLPQAVLPPQERPHLPTLRRLGYSGTDAQILARVARSAPELLAAVSSASAMWTANAATVSPSADCADARVHITPANLCSNLHRAIETETTARVLKAVFPDPSRFVHHAPLPATPMLGDEGAANHTRLCSDYGDPGLELFVYGRGGDDEPRPARYPARQTRMASAAIARLHELDAAATFFAQQHPEAIDAGVFHNDVIAVGNREVLLYHEQAFVDAQALRGWICTHLPGERRPVFIEISETEVSLDAAIASYLFNSQLVCPADGGMRLIVARECEETPAVWSALQRILADDRNPINGIAVFDLRQSMQNGGGPACLRLRVVLTPAERAAVAPGVWITPERHAELLAWVDAHYRDRLTVDDLADPQLLEESRTALDRLTALLKLGSLYDFQRN
ncbi:N-succinylarginine dihydrolase [Sinimarinibacterium thermocellulolyticum]|uniref:N-succinylarginine dihydrolase n=1 Tax=Sinimarinibacterium thermocellulolyticum TaxID=3170016 RepID=A0ABV2AA24_9GAMM